MPGLNEEVGIDPGLADLPLEHIAFDAKVIGGQVEVEVTQHFGNQVDHSVEAIYTFPLPGEANVLGVEMQIGDRHQVVADLREKKQARQDYETARDEGHHAALLEQERPNVFTMSVAGIEPGEKIRVKTRFSAPVPYHDGGRLMLPLVVAPRFVPAAGGTDTDGNPTDTSKIAPRVTNDVNYDVAIKVHLTPGYAADVASPSHDQIIKPCSLARGETCMIEATDLRSDRDVVITYRNKEALPTIKVDRTKFQPVEGEVEDFALVQIAAGTTEASNKPVQVVFALDHSGSMSGPKLAGMKRVACKALKQLEGFDREVEVAIIAFESSSKLLVPFSRINKAHYEAINAIHVQGGTELGRALSLAMDQFDLPGAVGRLLGRTNGDVERCILVVSDGETESLRYNKRAGVRIHTVGIDTAVNDDLLRGLARETGGTCEWVLPSDDFDAVASRIAGMVSGPVVRNLQIEDLGKNPEVEDLGDVFVARPRTFAVRLPKGINTFVVKGDGADGHSQSWEINVPDEHTTMLGAHLWAKSRMKSVQDDGEKTRISLRYGIVGPTTAFVAVSEKAVPGEKPVRVDVPVLLPHTWENQADAGGIMVGFAACAVMPAACHRSLAPLGLTGSVRRFSGSPSPIRGGVRNFAGDLDDFGDFKRAPAPSMFDDMDIPGPELTADVSETLDVLTSQDLLEVAELLLAQCKDPVASRVFTDPIWDRVKEFFDTENAQNFKGWDEVRRCKLFAVLVELQSYAYKLDIPAVLKLEPREPEAIPFWKRGWAGIGLANSAKR